MLNIDQHFAKINAKPMPPLGEEWEVDEETYWYFLEVLPPIYGVVDSWCFYMSEFEAGSVTARFRKDGERYFACYVDAAANPYFPWKIDSDTSRYN